MKKVFFLLSLAAVAYGSTSCKKCIECSYPVGGGIRTQQICGSSSAVETGKTNFITEAGADSAKVVCVDK